MRFEDFWSRAVALLKEKTDSLKEEREEKLFVATWTVRKGFAADKFPVRDVSSEKITCLTIHAGKPVELPKSDMEILYNNWDDYVQGQASRLEIVEKVPRTTYALSLMKYLKDNVTK